MNSNSALNTNPDLPALANHVEVHESIVSHASDVIYWLNAASAENNAKMRRIMRPLDLQVSTRPSDSKLLHKAGQTAVLRRSMNALAKGAVSDIDKTRPEQDSYDFNGEAWDHSRHFNPARFALSLGSGNGAEVALYPSPLGTEIGSGGGIYGNLRIQATQAPVIWGLLTLIVDLGDGNSQTYRAQCDSAGDFVIALKRLPPLPEGQNNYNAVLRLSGDIATNAAQAPDLSTYVSFELESSNTSNAFATDMAFVVQPGNLQRVQSNNRTYIAAQTA